MTAPRPTPRAMRSNGRMPHPASGPTSAPRDFAALDPATTVAVLPLGATEQHGPHLPLAVDQCLVDGVTIAALPRLPADLPVLFLPTQQVGYSPSTPTFAGTLTCRRKR